MKYEPRKLMMLAIDAMRKSVSEPRPDGKSPPLVGAAIYKKNGAVAFAHRSELRDGDHAEFTLLERKHRSEKLDGAILFATLEPCAPGARHAPKLACAERIVLARIKEVWVGIEDPDPTVDRKGIKILQDQGVTVNMISRDLQEIIRQDNKEFIKGALKRAAVAKSAPREMKLSPYEATFGHSEIGDLSIPALQQYQSLAGIAGRVGSPEFNRHLARAGLLEKKGDTFLPTGFAILLFGKRPRDAMPQAGLLGTIHYPNGRAETRNFDGPMVLIPGQVEQWLHDKLPNTIDRSHMRRQSVAELPFELVREAVVNALVHRDYAIKGAKCQLIVTTDTVTIKSPGGPLPPITLTQLQSFDAPMLSRNPELHYIFAQMELAEERGLGLKSLRTLSEQHGLPRPLFKMQEPYLALTLFRTLESTTHSLPAPLRERLNEDETRVWQFASTKESLSSPMVTNQFGFEERKAQRILRKLEDNQLLRRHGKGRATRYEVIRR